MTPLKKTALALVCAVWVGVMLVSLNHLFHFWDQLAIPVSMAGILGWGTFCCTVLLLAWRDLLRVSILFLLFFGAGYATGPFLEPPGDPFDHLRITHSYCDQSTETVRRLNKGLWQYSMNGALICSEENQVDPETVMERISLLHGLYWGGSAAILYLVASSAGLPLHWTLFSIMTAFLFMGTNRFSYFSYYSLAPSYTSLWIYWLWIAAFFFRKSFRAYLSGTIAAILLLPVILVNHIQEAVFLLFLGAIWIFLGVNGQIWKTLSRWPSRLKGRWWKAVYVTAICTVLFLLPQSAYFRSILSAFFLFDNWQVNQEAVVSWRGFHLMGKIWGYRVGDTLGLAGLLPAFLFPLAIWLSGNDRTGKRYKIFLLGILPLLVYCIPLLHYIWLSNCEKVPTHIRYYYRICYSSLFWVPIAYLFFQLEEKITGSHGGRSTLPGVVLQGEERSRFSRAGYILACLLLVFAGSIRSGPVYGKLDFLLLDTTRWWKAWKPMIEQVADLNARKIYTDPTTFMVLNNIFNLPATVLRKNSLPVRTAEIERLDTIGARKGVICLVNMHAYPSSWVPVETRHWPPRVADPTRYYVSQGVQGEKLAEKLRVKPPENCLVYY